MAHPDRIDRASYADYVFQPPEPPAIVEHAQADGFSEAESPEPFIASPVEDID